MKKVILFKEENYSKKSIKGKTNMKHLYEKYKRLLRPILEQEGVNLKRYFRTLEKLEHWIEVFGEDITIRELKEWANCIDDPETAYEYKELGFDPFEACEWYGYQLAHERYGYKFTPEDAKKLSDAGLDKYDADLWRRAGYSVEETIELSKKYTKPDDVPPEEE